MMDTFNVVHIVVIEIEKKSSVVYGENMEETVCRIGGHEMDSLFATRPVGDGRSYPDCSICLRPFREKQNGHLSP